MGFPTPNATCCTAGASEGAEVGEGEAPALPAVDYSIKPGEMITIKLNVVSEELGSEGQWL